MGEQGKGNIFWRALKWILARLSELLMKFITNGKFRFGSITLIVFSYNILVGLGESIAQLSPWPLIFNLGNFIIGVDAMIIGAIDSLILNPNPTLLQYLFFWFDIFAGIWIIYIFCWVLVKFFYFVYDRSTSWLGVMVFTIIVAILVRALYIVGMSQQGLITLDVANWFDWFEVMIPFIPSGFKFILNLDIILAPGINFVNTAISFLASIPLLGKLFIGLLE